MEDIRSLLRGDAAHNRIVPPTGYTVRLTLFSAAAMAFLAVFALALSLAADRLADRWSDALAKGATLRISAAPEELDAQVAAAMAVLDTTPGVASARVLSDDEQRALLEPWFGPDLPIETLRVPQLIAVSETDEGFDAGGLRLRLSAEVPGAVLDDHARWRKPLLAAAGGLRWLGWIALLLIMGATAAMVTLAANAACDAAELVAQLRAQHHAAQADSKESARRFAGLDLRNGEIRDNLAAGVVEPALAKVKSFRFATEAAISLLRVDEVIKLNAEKPPEDPHGH